MSRPLQFFVIAYDIQSDRRRRKVENILKGFGQRANLSVFECEMKEMEFNRVRKEIDSIINARTDIVLYYPLCKACLGKRFRTGNAASGRRDDSTVI